MIIFFSLFSLIALVFFYNLDHVRKNFFFLITVRFVCLTNLWVLSMPQWCFAWWELREWATEKLQGKLLCLSWSQLGKQELRFWILCFCKIPGNAEKSYEHSKSFLLISNSTFRCFRNLLGLRASSCGFIPSEKHVIVIGGSVQCLFVFPKPHSGFLWHLAVIIFVMPLVHNVCNNLLCSASGLLVDSGVKSAFGQVSVCSSSCASQVVLPTLRMFSDLFSFQSLHNLPKKPNISSCACQKLSPTARLLLQEFVGHQSANRSQHLNPTSMNYSDGTIKDQIIFVCMKGSKLNWQTKPDSCCHISGVLDLKSSQGCFNTILCLHFPVVLEDPLGRKQQIIQYRNRSW